MCGRFRLSRRKQVIAERFDAMSDDDDWNPRYNVAPTQPIPVVRQHPAKPTRHLSQMLWGLIPSWSKDDSHAAKMINARSETVATLPAFKDAFRSRRCLIPADGFYEWKSHGTYKQPYCFEVNNGELFAFAGLWDGWKAANGEWIRSCTILTTTANAISSAVHDRMPVILNPADYDLWLDPGMRDESTVASLLQPFDAKAMRCYPVSNRVNSAMNDDAGCAEPAIITSPPQGLLFG